jgi:uncharacterized membrane protein (UPF0127 family)
VHEESVSVADQGAVGLRPVPQLEARTTRRRTRLKGLALVGPAGQIVCERCYVAERSLPRIRGLIGWSELAPGEGMLLRPSWSIHTAFVGYPIDAVFLDGELAIIGVAHLKPFRAALRLGARAVLELPAGTCERLGLKPGDRLGWGRV